MTNVLLWVLCAFARPLSFDDLTRPVQLELRREEFPQLIAEIGRSTVEREIRGESDHMVFYALQSRKFTALPAIEPAISAKAFVDGLPDSQRTCYLAGTCVAKLGTFIPEDTQRRLREFAKALQSNQNDERLTWFRQHIRSPDLQTDYVRTMLFLYLKEFGPKRGSALYEQRGHSTDTSVAANYAVWQGLSVLHAMRPMFRVRRVLIVGPGLDFSPRTGFDESAAPQSYQPFAVLDALRALGMGDAAIHCVDINDRVVSFFRNVTKLTIHSTPGDADYRRYFGQLGSKIGSTSLNGWTKVIQLSGTHVVTAEKLNILTEHPDGEGYDLVIATNVLLYFDEKELLLAISNIAGLMKPGAFFLHNDLRPALDRITSKTGLEAIAARTVRISPDTFDSFALYTK